MSCRRWNPASFVQVHRAAIVNLYFVARIPPNRPGRSAIGLNHGLGADRGQPQRGQAAAHVVTMRGGATYL